MAVLRAARRAEIVTAALVVAALVLLALPDSVQRGVSSRANHVVLLPVSGLRTAFAGYLQLREENERLRTELQRARLEVSSGETVRAQNRELRRLLDFAANQPVRLVPARIVDRDFGTLPTTFVIDAGREDGIGPNMPVVDADGLVGKTVDVGPGASQVMLYTHPEFSASALLVGGDHLEYGVVRPAPDGTLRLYLPLRSESKVGDPVVTSGYGGAYPRGIPIGRVVAVREDARLGLQKIDVIEPETSLGSVTAVFVLRRQAAPRRSAGDVIRLFWPGYAYPPMTGESLGEPDTVAATAEPSPEESGS